MAAGNRSPGVMVARPLVSFGRLVAFPELVSHAGDPADDADAVSLFA